MSRFHVLMPVAVLAVTATAGKVFAQEPVEIKFHCQVRGYPGWVRVVNGANTGGRVIRERSGTFATDRVARGEKFRISIDDKSFTRSCQCEFVLEAQVQADNRTLSRQDITIPYKTEFEIPDDPKFRNVVITVFDPIAPGGKVSRRIPIGSR